MTAIRCAGRASGLARDARPMQRLQPVRDAANPTTGAEFCDHFDTAARALTPTQRA